MKTRILILIMSILSSVAYGQGEANIWYFGTSTGLDFNTTPPTLLTSSSINTLEGCASISNKYGRLLFYSDGRQVWDSTHTLMPNGTGLGGHSSSTQSAVVVQVRPDTYMLFTIDIGGGPKGLQFNVVDMSLNNGKGDISLKNQAIHSGDLAEKIGIAKHSNGNSFWVIVKNDDLSIYYSYLVTDTVVNTTPVTSNVGTLSGAAYDGNGYLKVSPDQTKVAAADYASGLELYDFNPSTGELSNPKKLYSNSSGLVYGVEFSSNNKYLYTGKNSGVRPIVQYDISSGVTSTIIASETVVGNGAGGWTGAFQMAPDERIYITFNSFGNYLGVINKPNLAGTACDYEVQGFDISPRVGKLGLPTFFSAYLPGAVTTYNKQCIGDSTEFKVANNYVYDSVAWSFDDPTSGPSNFSSDTFAKHVFSDTGVYDVRLIVYQDTLTDTVINSIQIFPYPVVSLGADTVMCDGQEVNFDFEYLDADKILWSDSTTNNSYSFVDSGVYWVEVNKYGCITRDTFKVDIEPAYLFNINDTFSCYGDTIHINIGSGAQSYLWSNNDTDSILAVNVPGTYHITAQIDDCYTYDTIDIEFRNKPLFSLGNDTTICEDGEAIYSLFGLGAGHTFLWNNTSTNPYIAVKTPSTVSVQVEKDGCYEYDTAEVFVNNYFKTPPLNDTLSCVGDSLIINIGSGAETYTWSHGNYDSLVMFIQSGVYYVQAANGNCVTTDSIKVNFFNKPIFTLGADSILCSTDSITLAGTNNIKHEWSTGDTNQNLTVKQPGEYILTQSTQYCSYKDTIAITMQQQPSLYIGADTVICKGEKVTIGSSIPNGMQYTWSHLGNSTPKVIIDKSDEYSVIAYDGICYAYDTVELGIYNPHDIELGADTTLCDGTAIELDVSINNGEYTWNDGVKTPKRIITQSGYYSVLVKDSVCIKQLLDDITVTFNPVPPLNLGPDTVLCQDEIYEVNIDNTWEKADWVDGSNQFNRVFTTEGGYVVTTSYLNCQHTDSIEIGYHPPLPSFSLGDDEDVCDPLFFPLKVDYTGYYGTRWQDGTLSNYYEVTKTGEYIISTLPHRCGQVSDTINITFLRELCDLHVPNAFTPNGDGDNDYFYPIGYQMEIENMKIFNRWGELLFDANEPWDGTYKGVKLPNGAYLYVITYKLEYRGYKRRVQSKGTVHILK